MRLQRSSLAQLLRRCEPSARSEVVHSERHDDATAHFTYSSFTRRRSPFIWVRRRDVCAERGVSSGKGSFCICTCLCMILSCLIDAQVVPSFVQNTAPSTVIIKPITSLSSPSFAVHSFVFLCTSCATETPDDLFQLPFLYASHHE